MPYSRLPIPIQGLTDSLSFRQAAEGFTKRCKNVFPFDAFDNKRRVGTRQGFLQLAKPGSTIQGMISTESFVTASDDSTSIDRQLIYVVDGKIFVTNLSANPVQATAVSSTSRNAFDAEYDSESTDLTKQPRGTANTASGSQVVEALPDFTGGDSSSNQVFSTTASVEMAVMKHVGRADEIASGAQRAAGKITIDSNLADGETITIIDTAGASKAYVARSSASSALEFAIGADATATATNLATKIESADGHNGTIIVERDSSPDGDIYITQREAGIAGNTTISDGGSGNISLVQFAGGLDAAPHNYVYMTDGTKYVKVDVSVTPAKVSQWIGPYKTVVASNKRAKLIQSFGPRMVLSGIDTAPTNWFFSKINDPFDWTPGSGSDLLVDALAGSSGTKFGQIGDNIKALVPVGTNSLVFGCTNSMVMMTGDPAFTDVKFRSISRTVGVLGPRAFTPVGEMSSLIASTEGVFGIDPNTFDIERGARVSKDRLDGLFARLDFENTNIVMGYDDARSVALMAVTKTDDESSSEIFALDMSNGGWWQWQIATSSMRGINSIVSFRPTISDRSAPLLGTTQGHLLSQPEGVVLHQDGATDSSVGFTSSFAPSTDEGTDIDSELVIGPINSDPSRRILLKDVRIILGEKTESDTDTLESGPFMSLLFGDTAQNAIGFTSGGNLTTTNTVIDGGTSATSGFDTALLGVNPLDGGDVGESTGDQDSDYTAILWGGLAFDADGTYVPNTTGTLLNNTVFSGPSNWTLTRTTAGKWQLKNGGVAYYETENVVSGLPTTIRLNQDSTPPYLPATGHVGTLVTTGFAEAQSTSNVQLARGRSTAKRSRTRASDIFVKIGANSRAWALEDVSVDVEDGGPVRSVS